MSVHLERARLLLGQNRYEQAERELGLALVDDAQNATAHALMAVCLLARDEFSAATDQAAEAVRLDPDSPVAHGVAAQVWLVRNYLDRAEQAARTAIALDPLNAHYQSQLSQILFRAERWPEALEAAQAALSIDPEDIDGLNLQAAALRQLGRTAEAQGSLREALQQSPDEAWTHANLGWSCLQNGNQPDAERHFREALRLDPELEIARTGIIEAIKAKNRVYRAILRGFMWLSRRTTQGQWYLVLGAYLGYRVAMDMIDQHPQWGIVLWPLIFAYIGFVLLSWFRVPLSNLCLRLHPLGKLALSKDERRASNWVGGALGCGLVLLVLAIAFDSSLAKVTAIGSAVFAIPLAMTFSCKEPKPRRWMTIYTLAVGATGAFILTYLLLDSLLVPQVFARLVGGVKNLKTIGGQAINCVPLYLWGCALSVWAVNIAQSIAWKR